MATDPVDQRRQERAILSVEMGAAANRLVSEHVFLRQIGCGFCGGEFLDFGVGGRSCERKSRRIRSFPESFREEFDGEMRIGSNDNRRRGQTASNERLTSLGKSVDAGKG